MAIELSSDLVICHKCGKGFSKRRGFFPSCFSGSCIGVSFLPICKECFNKQFEAYLTECGDTKKVVRQMCRKFDMYWSDDMYNATMANIGDKNVMTIYLQKINNVKYHGKTYDDSLIEQGTLWTFDFPAEPEEVEDEQRLSVVKDSPVPDEVVEFWGSGYTVSLYNELEQRRNDWMTKLEKEGVTIDAGTEALIKQICSLEIDINKARASGKTVDKLVNTLNTLLGSANLKPTQKKSDDADSSLEKTPFGVWIRRWENDQPIPDPTPEMEDADGIIKYMLTWVYGHLARMFNIKNAHSRLYEEEIEKWRIERPEYDDEDDDDFLYDVLGSEEGEDDINV